MNLRNLICLFFFLFFPYVKKKLSFCLFLIFGPVYFFLIFILIHLLSFLFFFVFQNHKTIKYHKMYKQMIIKFMHSYIWCIYLILNHLKHLHQLLNGIKTCVKEIYAHWWWEIKMCPESLKQFFFGGCGSYIICKPVKLVSSWWNGEDIQEVSINWLVLNTDQQQSLLSIVLFVWRGMYDDKVEERKNSLLYKNCLCSFFFSRFFIDM